MATQNSSRARKAKAETPMQALDRLLKRGKAGKCNLFSVSGMQRGAGYTESASLSAEDFEIYAKSLSAKNNIFSIRSPMAPIERIVTRYKGGFFDALLVQAYGRIYANPDDKEILSLDHVSTYY